LALYEPCIWQIKKTIKYEKIVRTEEEETNIQVRVKTRESEKRW
jgi:hypothetical protein